MALSQSSDPTQTANEEFTLKGRTTPPRSLQSSSLPPGVCWIFGQRDGREVYAKDILLPLYRD